MTRFFRPSTFDPRLVTLFLLLTSSAIAAPTIIEYRRQEGGVGNTMASTLEIGLYATKLVGEIGFPDAFETLSIWRPILSQSEVGHTYTLTAADPEFAGFHTAAPGLVPRTHYLLLRRKVGGQDLPSGELWNIPSSPAFGTQFAFDLNRVEVTLVQYFTSQIGSRVEWDVRLVGNVPEPASWLMLCVGLVHIAHRRRR